MRGFQTGGLGLVPADKLNNCSRNIFNELLKVFILILSPVVMILSVPLIMHFSMAKMKVGGKTCHFIIESVSFPPVRFSPVVFKLKTPFNIAE